MLPKTRFHFVLFFTFLSLPLFFATPTTAANVKITPRDHVGDQHIKHPNAGTCATPDTKVNALPDTNSVNIVLANKARIITGSEMPKFFAGKQKRLNADPKASQAAFWIVGKVAAGNGRAEQHD